MNSGGGHNVWKFGMFTGILRSSRKFYKYHKNCRIQKSPEVPEVPGSSSLARSPKKFQKVAAVACKVTVPPPDELPRLRFP